MAWCSDWQARCDRLRVNGLLVLVEDVRVDPTTGFVAVYFVANEGDLPRSHVDRDFQLHMTLGYASDYADGVALRLATTLRRRWAGRLLRLRVGWFGGGGSAQLAYDDVLAQDPDIHWLHSRGHYGNGVNVLPRQLHVSL